MQENKQKILEFVKTYENNYSDKMIEYIKNTLDNDINTNYRYDFMNQIYSGLDLLNKENDPYLKFIDILKKKYDISTNILEIGAGFFPALARKIDIEQIKIGQGTITVYDPNLITKSLGNIKLKKENFTNKTNINDFDTLIGFWPCKSTELIVTKACAEKKLFSLVLCECMHDVPENDEGIFYWQDYIYELSNKLIDKSFKISTEYINHGNEKSSLVLSCIKRK